MLCKWNFEPWPRDKINKSCLGKLGSWSMKYLRGEVGGADGQCSGMSQGPWQEPLIVSQAGRDSVQGIVGFSHSMDRELRDPGGSCWLARAEICWKVTYSLPSSSCSGSFQ